MFKSVAIGKATILEFLKPFGFEVIECEDFPALANLLREKDLSSYTLLILTEDLLHVPTQEILSLYTSLPLPVLILPTPVSRKGLGKEVINQLVRHTLGMELWKEQKS